MVKNKRLPTHIGIIPDGNRRWAMTNHYEKHEGYEYGIEPGFLLYELLIEYGIKEATFYGFTADNTKRASVQREAFSKACVDSVKLLSNKDANLLVIGNTESSVFPKELLPYANKRVHFGKGLVNINFLVNYDWKWDLNKLTTVMAGETKDIYSHIMSADISRMDLIIRWGGRRRLSGFLPVQSVYSDIYILDAYWPDFSRDHFEEALDWYQTTDVTLGG
jgi:undecaprenyl diphosphate synthase